MKKTFSGILLTLLLISMLTLACDIRPVKAIQGYTIKSDGSIEPLPAPISTTDNVTYTITGDIPGWIDVMKGNITIDGNGCKLQGDGALHGFWVEANNVTIENASISGFERGIDIESVNYTTVTDNNITSCFLGVFVAGTYNPSGLGLSYNTTIDANSATNCSKCILIDCSNYATVTGNIMSHNAYAGIEMIDSNGSIISGNTISDNNGTGIDISSSCDNTMTNNTINNNANGIWLEQNSTYNLINDSVVSENQGYGIYVNGSRSTTISSSSFTTINGSCVTNNGYGIGLEKSCDNAVTYNCLANNTKGVWLKVWCSRNTLMGNNITNNTSCGIEMYLSSGNTIYNNNFNNTSQTYGDSIGGNYWNAAYPLGGNYWSDYAGKDEKKGPNQDINGSDGIGDTKYNISTSAFDPYPLKFPYPLSYPLHDIGIINVGGNKTIVGQGYNLTLAVTMVNYGINSENFNLTLYCNDTSAVNENVPLPSRSINTFQLDWNTSSFPIGNYTINCTASSIEGETDTADNTHPLGTIHVGVPGNVNYFDGSRMVDMIDLWLIQKHYGAVKGQPGPLYVPNYDIEGNNKTDMIDLWIAQKNYGQTEPSWVAPPPVTPAIVRTDGFPWPKVFDKYHPWVDTEFDTEVKLLGLSSAWDITSASLTLDYSHTPMVLSVVNVTFDSVWAGPNSVDTSTPGLVNIFVQNPPSNAGGDVIIVTIRFRVVYQGSYPEPNEFVDLMLENVILSHYTLPITTNPSSNGHVWVESEI